jgi:hypothetical protein
MSKQTETNFFMFPPKALKYVGFYQELLKGIVDYERLGKRLVMLSEQARAFRQFDGLSEYALILSKLPLKRYQSIGQYYLALSVCRNGRGELDKARAILEKVASDAPLKYRAHAMVTLSSISWDINQPENTLRYCIEASRISGFSEITVKALRGIAVLKSFEGFHKSALRDLENMYQIVKYAPPHIYFDYLNSLAIELADCGRLYEARNVSKIVCSSPLISIYPEWQETARELKEPNRSFISIPGSLPQVERKHVEIEPEPIPEPEQEERPADVLPFTRPKEAPPPPKPDRIPQVILDHMTVSEKSQLVMSLVQSKTLSSYGYNKMLASVGMVKRGASAKEIELDDLAFMADLISDWCNLIDPRLFIGVISALRDCDDRVRRTNIMDNMISEAIRQTDDSIESEEESRRKYERRLPKSDF